MTTALLSINAGTDERMARIDNVVAHELTEVDRAQTIRPWQPNPMVQWQSYSVVRIEGTDRAVLEAIARLASISTGLDVLEIEVDQ